MFHQTYPQEKSFLLKIKVHNLQQSKISAILKNFRGQCPRVRTFFHVCRRSYESQFSNELFPSIFVDGEIWQTLCAHIFLKHPVSISLFWFINLTSFTLRVQLLKDNIKRITFSQMIFHLPFVLPFLYKNILCKLDIRHCILINCNLETNVERLWYVQPYPCMKQLVL